MRAHTHIYTSTLYWHGAILFSFSLCSRGRRAVRNSYPLAGSDSLSHYLYPIAGLTEPFLFVAVDGISSQLELDLSNPRVIALPARFSSFFPRLPPQNLSFYPVRLDASTHVSIFFFGCFERCDRLQRYWQ